MAVQLQSSHRAARLGAVIAALFCAGGFIVVEGVRSDRRLSDFCSAIELPMGLDQARIRATAKSYRVVDSIIAQPQAALDISDPLWLWPKSWCRLDHDGTRITGRTFNPWYE